MSVRYIDLFCGLGAFHTAFKDEFTCVLACDIDAGARAIYEANHGLMPEGDIRTLDLARMPDFEILCAGFPCQPFSIAGNGEGFQDKEKGNLFFDILKIVDAKNPPMCILENVKNLETHDDGNTFRKIKEELVKRGYVVSARVLNSAEFGSPQARHRVFIIATKNSFVFPIHERKVAHVSSILDPGSLVHSIDLSSYSLVAKAPDYPSSPVKPRLLYDVISKKTKKGGRQGERVYDSNATGITICASSGGPGAKTGLYKVGEKIRRLSVKECLGMFGFPSTYIFPGVSDEQALFYLGNSIVVNIVRSFVPSIKAHFHHA